MVSGRESLNPFPFFLSEYLPDDEDDGVVSLDLLFDPIEEDCGEVFQWSQEFFSVLARMTDDYDAELECGGFAGNLDDDDLRLIVLSSNRPPATVVSESELNRRLENVSALVSTSDCGDHVLDKVESRGGSVKIHGCQNVQLVQDNGRAVQHVLVDKSFSCFAWTMTIIGGVISAVISAGVIWLVRHYMSDGA